MQLTTAHGRRAWRSYRRARRVLVKPRHVSRMFGIPGRQRERLLIGKYEETLAANRCIDTSLPHRSSVRLLKPVELVRYKQLVFGHGFRSAEGPVGRNGALPGPSCAQETAFSCRRRTAGAHDERAVACARYALSAAICVTRAGRITYERRVEYHRPLVSHLARLSPCVHESASSTRLARR